MNARAALLAVLQRVPARLVAARCAVSTREVRRWASGERAPSSKARRALASFRIDPAWPWPTRADAR